MPLLAESPSEVTAPEPSAPDSSAGTRTPRPHRRPAPHRPTVLHGVTWDDYVGLREKSENDHVRFTYDGPAGGLLEIEMPLGIEHESVSELLAAFIAAFARRRGIGYRGVGSVTQSRRDLDRGLEGDKCFYLKNAARMRGVRRLDLAGGDPPPDLAVEVDVTSRGVSKLPIYAALGVPEVWVWSDDALVCRVLGDAGEYEVRTKSRELPGFPLPAAEELAARWADEDADALVAAFEGRVGATES